MSVPGMYMIVDSLASNITHYTAPAKRCLYRFTVVSLRLPVLKRIRSALRTQPISIGPAIQTRLVNEANTFRFR